MTYKIGTRVRKVRGIADIGMTGLVIDTDPDCALGYTILVRGDRPMTVKAWGSEESWEGPEAWGHPDHWVPILDRHEPCESEFKESLDKLLSEVSRASVE